MSENRVGKTDNALGMARAACDAAVSVSEAAFRIHAGAGIMRDYPVGRIHRDAVVYAIGDGTSDIQRNFIARDLGVKT